MSLQKRRNSLFKSSISIRSIGDALQSFSEGLVSARKNSDDSIKTIRQRNIFKRNSIRSDNLYFRKRQENIRRKAREDELEASSVQGVPKTQGSILAKSTRGFLGRMLDFIGILIIGWAIQNLPKILKAIQGLIKRISSVTGILSLFIDGIKFVLSGIGTLIQNTISNLIRFDFLKTKKDVEEGLENANAGLSQARNELVTASTEFLDPENYGLPTPPGFDLDNPQEMDSKESDAQELAKYENIDEPPELVAKRDEITKNIDDTLENQKEQSGVVEGDADNIEGKDSDIGTFLTEAEGTSGGEGGSSKSAPSGASVVDPSDELKKKQKEALERDSRVNRRERRRRRTNTSFSNSVENINQSVTSNSQNEYRGEVKASVEITDEIKGLTPVKKDVNVAMSKKRRKIMIVDNSTNNGNGNQSLSMPATGGSSRSRSAVDDEKILMKMQSTSTFKYT